MEPRLVMCKESALFCILSPARVYLFVAVLKLNPGLQTCETSTLPSSCITSQHSYSLFALCAGPHPAVFEGSGSAGDQIQATSIQCASTL